MQHDIDTSFYSECKIVVTYFHNLQNLKIRINDAFQIPSPNEEKYLYILVYITARYLDNTVLNKVVGLTRQGAFGSGQQRS